MCLTELDLQRIAKCNLRFQQNTKEARKNLSRSRKFSFRRRRNALSKWNFKNAYYKMRKGGRRRKKFFKKMCYFLLLIFCVKVLDTKTHIKKFHKGYYVKEKKEGLSYYCLL